MLASPWARSSPSLLRSVRVRPVSARAGNAATEWNIVDGRHPHQPAWAGRRRTAGVPDQRGVAQGAVYDAVNAIGPGTDRNLINSPFPGDRLEGRGGRDRGVHRARFHRRDRTREHPVPEQGRRAAVARVAIRLLARSGTQLVRQGPGGRRGGARRPGDDRREGGEGGSGRLRGYRTRRPDIGSPSRPDRADPRSNPVGRPHEAVPHAELSQFRRQGLPRSRGPPARRSSTSEGVGSATARCGRPPRRTSPAGGRATPSRAGTTSPGQLVAQRARRRRQGPSVRDAEPERGRRGDQLLERQVPLGLLAAVERDPRGRARTATRRPPDPTWTALITAPYPKTRPGTTAWTVGHTDV